MRSHEKEFAPFVLPVSGLKRARASSWTEGKTGACMGCLYRISNTRRRFSKCTCLYECRKRPRGMAESRTRTSSSSATATRWRRRRCGAARWELRMAPLRLRSSTATPQSVPAPLPGLCSMWPPVGGGNRMPSLACTCSFAFPFLLIPSFSLCLLVYFSPSPFPGRTGRVGARVAPPHRRLFCRHAHCRHGRGVCRCVYSRSRLHSKQTCMHQQRRRLLPSQCS